MRVAFFDMVGGAAGDMVLAALLDVGADARRVEAALAPASLPFSLRHERVDSSGILVSRVEVLTQDETDHRHLDAILEIIARADAPARAKERASDAFMALGRAEAKAHGTDIEHVHFHEVGAVDAIVDIVGSAVLCEDLGLERMAASEFPLGRGVIHCQHGVMPAPAPATVNLLEGAPVTHSDTGFETVTPTGAAILSTFCESFGPMPAMRLQRTGTGTGARERVGIPNWLRVLIGEQDRASEEATVVAIETNLDDMTPEAIAHLTTILMDSGALDCYVTPIVMKKGRPAQLLTVLASQADQAQLSDSLLRNSSTFGIRLRSMTRLCLERKMASVSTEYGEIRVKIGFWEGERVKVAAEFEDCRLAAERCGAALSDVQRAAERAYHAAG